MICTTPHEKLHAWLDGELNAGEARAMTEHVAACPYCRKRVRDMTALFDALEALPGPERSPELAEVTVRAALAEDDDPCAWWRGLSALHKSAGVAAVAAGLLLGIFLYNASPLASYSLKAMLGQDSTIRYALSEVDTL